MLLLLVCLPFALNTPRWLKSEHKAPLLRAAVIPLKTTKLIGLTSIITILTKPLEESKKRQASLCKTTNKSLEVIPSLAMEAATPVASEAIPTVAMAAVAKAALITVATTS